MASRGDTVMAITYSKAIILANGATEIDQMHY